MPLNDDAKWKTHLVLWQTLVNRAPSKGPGKDMKAIMQEMASEIEQLSPSRKGLIEVCECKPACKGEV